MAENKLSMSERQGLVRELKELLEGVPEKESRREIITGFVESKKESGVHLKPEDFDSLAAGPTSLARTGKPINLEDLCPSAVIRIPSIDSEVKVPTTEEALLFRNYVLTEGVRSLVSSQVMYLMKRMNDSKGADRPTIEELTKLTYLVQQNNSNAKKEWESIVKKIDPNADGNEVDIGELTQDLRGFLEQHLNRGKKKKKQPDVDVMDIARDVTSSLKKKNGADPE